MRRVAIIGNAGGGKSRLARALSRKLQLPLHVVDDVQWLPGWEVRPTAEFDRVHERWLATDAWVIDGFGNRPAIERRFARADTIILVDLPFARHCWWAARRHVRALLGRGDGWPPPGCSAWSITARLARVMWRIHCQDRHELRALAEAFADSARFIHVRTFRQLTALTETSLGGRRDRSGP